MRRIFNLTPSTSSQDASHSLAYAHDSSSSAQPSGPPPLSSATAYPDHGPEEPTSAKKGWFESALTGVSGTLVGVGGVVGRAGQVRSESSTKPSTGAMGAQGAKDDEDEEYVKLPFGSARVQSPPPSRAAGDFYRSPPRVGGGGHGRAFSGASARASVMSGASLESERDMIMVELLSGQAVIETKDYQILDWDEMQDIKKEHALLATRTASLSRSLALETKLRDSAAKLVRLSAPSTPSTPTSLSASGRPRVTKEQAEAQLATASAKVAALSAELYRSGWKEAALRTQLLQHTAAVLSLAVRRKDESESGVPLSPLPAPATSRPPLNGRPQTLLNGVDRNSLSPSKDPTTQLRFEGAHFFAGNREAIAPQRRLGSPFTSPQLSAALNGTFPTSSVADMHLVKELEAHVSELQADLAAAMTEIARRTKVESELVNEVDAMRNGHQEQGVELTQTRDAMSAMRHELAQTRNNLERAEREVEGLRLEVDEARTESEKLRVEGENLSRDAGAQDDGRPEAADLTKRLGMARLEQEEANHRAEAAEEKLAEAERDLAQTRRDLEAATQRGEEIERQSPSAIEGNQEAAALRTQLDARTDERRRFIQAIGDVLRRHRIRSAVGAVLRDVPAFDDTAETEGSGLAAYVSSSLDDHFEALSKHVQGLEQERDGLQLDKVGLEDSLRQTVEHRDRLGSEADMHRLDKEALEAQVQKHESSVTMVERELALVKDEDARKRDQLAALQTQLVDLEAQLADTTADHTRSLKTLQDLWLAIPPLDTRTAAANEDDLSALKKAFETPRKPMGNFLNDVAAEKFTIESLAERIRVLLADDVRLVQKLVEFESTKDVHRTDAEQARREADRATKSLGESTATVQNYQKQVKDLEERIEVSSKQDVTMLERLNDLTESLEQTRAEKRKLESQLSGVQSQLSSIQAEKVQLSTSLQASQAEVKKLAARPDDSAKVAELEATIAELNDTQTDLQEELEDARKREQKQRSQLLDQLNTVEQEVSSLKTQLRQEQRKKGKP